MPAKELKLPQKDGSEGLDDDKDYLESIDDSDLERAEAEIAALEVRRFAHLPGSVHGNPFLDGFTSSEASVRREAKGEARGRGPGVVKVQASENQEGTHPDRHFRLARRCDRLDFGLTARRGIASLAVDLPCRLVAVASNIACVPVLFLH